MKLSETREVGRDGQHEARRPEAPEQRYQQVLRSAQEQQHVTLVRRLAQRHPARERGQEAARDQARHAGAHEVDVREQQQQRAASPETVKQVASTAKRPAVAVGAAAAGLAGGLVLRSRTRRQTVLGVPVPQSLGKSRLRTGREVRRQVGRPGEQAVRQDDQERLQGPRARRRSGRAHRQDPRLGAGRGHAARSVPTANGPALGAAVTAKEAGDAVASAARRAPAGALAAGAAAAGLAGGLVLGARVTPRRRLLKSAVAGPGHAGRPPRHGRHQSPGAWSPRRARRPSTADDMRAIRAAARAGEPPLADRDPARRPDAPPRRPQARDLDVVHGRAGLAVLALDHVGDRGVLEDRAGGGGGVGEDRLGARRRTGRRAARRPRAR